MKEAIGYMPVMGREKLTPQDVAGIVSEELRRGFTKEQIEGIYRIVYLINALCSRGGNEDLKEATDNLLYLLEQLR